MTVESYLAAHTIEPADVLHISLPDGKDSYRMHVTEVIEPLRGFKIANGWVLGQHDRPVRPMSFPTYAGIPYEIEARKQVLRWRGWRLRRALNRLLRRRG